MTSDARVVLDCRWLSIGGAGRLTELLLRGLSQRPAPPGWLLWGPPSVEALAWPGTELSFTVHDPREWLGQREKFRIPDGDLVVFMHQQRPLCARPSMTVVHDTIALRHGSTPLGRMVKGAFMRRVGRMSIRLVTISSYSRDCIRRDLGVAAERISVLPIPCDTALVARVCALRDTAPVADVALYVGNFLGHKNLRRLVEAFGRTAFRYDGGRLLVVGGSTADVDRFTSALDRGLRSFVEVRPACTQEELDRLYARSLFLVQPSLEEGFGLPAWEALCCGLPVAASERGSLPEVVGPHGDRFDPTSVTDIAGAIDRCAVRARALSPAALLRLSQEFVRRAPTVADMAAAFEDLVTGALGPGARPRPAS